MRLLIDLQAAQGTSRTRGIGRYARELALAMARAPGRHQVVALLNTALPHEELAAALRAELPADGVALWRGPRGVAADGGDARLRGAGEMLRAQAIAALRPDMLHVASVVEGFSDDVISRWPPSLSRPPTMATCYDLIPLIRRAEYIDGPWRGALAPWYLGRLAELAQADGLLAISGSSRGEAIEWLGFAADRVADIGAGVAPAFRPPDDPGAMAAMRARLGLEGPFVLFVGAGDPRKNEAGLLRGFARLAPPLRDAHRLVIVGHVDVEALHATARALGLAPDRLVHITFVAEADLPALYAACALFVMPSLHEGFGLPAAEAMACGAPTIASNCTSLPEVIGRADALFDPLDPDDMARCMAAVLGDPARAAALRAHAPVQAARFTWANSAAAAWAAIEALHAGLGHPAARPPRRLKRLALVSPLPPQESGIAAHVAALAPALARHYAVTLVCERGATSSETLAGLAVIGPDAFLAQADGFDRVLYHVGNSAFHQVQLERLLPAVPGVVTLHDAFLSNLLAWRGEQDGGMPFTLELLRAHGWAAVLHAARAGASAAARRYPCSLGVLRRALAVVLHSEHGRAVLAAKYGPAVAAQLRVIPLLAAPGALPDRAAARRALGLDPDALVVASFGSASDSKMPDLLLDAWRILAADPGWAGARLVLAGEATAATEARMAGLARVAATGWTDAGTYRQWLAAADIAVQLRRDSRGETSAAVADCLAAGLATVVNAHGSAAELPRDTVVMLPDAVDAASLAEAMTALAADPARRAALGAAARRHAARELTPAAIAARYAEVIEAAHTEGPAAARRAVARSLPAGMAPGEGADLAAALAASFPAPRPPQLLVAGAPPGLDGWLAHHPAALRVHPVCAEDGVLRQDWALASRLLGLEPISGLGDAAEMAPGDVLLLAEPELAAPVLAEPVLAEARTRGVRVAALADLPPLPADPAAALALLMAAP
jgi:glycosyltransferase involved in cell wall biosynthesis